MRFRELKLKKNPDCVLCGPRPTVTKLIDYEAFCGVTPETVPAGAAIPEITVEELHALRERREPVVLVDVREPHEIAISSFSESVKIPLASLPQNLNRLSTADEIVVHCRTGVRSAQAVRFLREAGFRKVRNLAGGINRWAERIDPTMPKY
jgi:adenylyltransferase/sulfurtransferase